MALPDALKNLLCGNCLNLAAGHLVSPPVGNGQPGGGYRIILRVMALLQGFGHARPFFHGQGDDFVHQGIRFHRLILALAFRC